MAPFTVFVLQISALEGEKVCNFKAAYVGSCSLAQNTTLTFNGPAHLSGNHYVISLLHCFTELGIIIR